MLVLAWLVAAAILAPLSAAWGQSHAPVAVPSIPYADPDQLLRLILGEETEAERNELAQVTISPRDESRLGAAALDHFETRLKLQGVSVGHRGADVRYVQRLVAELRPLMTNARRYRNIRVLVADTDETDARSFPGGSIIISRGLIEFCESEAALVGVLGHELSHIDRGHQLYHLRRLKLAERSLSGQFNLDRLLATGGMLARIFARPFRPEEELQADQDGAAWAFALGYDPAELAHVFLRAHERDRLQPQRIPPFLQSHPFHEDRYRAILSQAESLAKENPAAELYVGRTNLQKRLPRAQHEFAEH